MHVSPVFLIWLLVVNSQILWQTEECFLCIIVAWVSCPLFYILVLSLPSSIHLVRHLMATSSSCYCIPNALPLVQLLVLSLQSLCHLLGLYHASLFSICILIFSMFICSIVYVLSLEFLGHVHMLCVVIIWCCKVSFFHIEVLFLLLYHFYWFTFLNIAYTGWFVIVCKKYKDFVCSRPSQKVVLNIFSQLLC